MLSINIDVPDSLLLKWDGSKETIRREMQKLLAIKLFEGGYLTSGQAAEMYGIHRLDFIEKISKMGIPVVNWDTGEIQEELENALRL